MNDFMLLMHSDHGPADNAAWTVYFADLEASGAFTGGSAMAPGTAYRRTGEPGPASVHLSGFIRVRAASREAAERCLPDNPVYEAGGTVEIVPLPRD